MCEFVLVWFDFFCFIGIVCVVCLMLLGLDNGFWFVIFLLVIFFFCLKLVFVEELDELLVVMLFWLIGNDVGFWVMVM